eukprot:scaffold23390_cov43-Attheya_sp.AAC.1
MIARRSLADIVSCAWRCAWSDLGFNTNLLCSTGSAFCTMEYDLARARNIDAAPVEMYWSARTRSFLPRPVQVHGTAFSPYVAYVGLTVAYGM